MVLISSDMQQKNQDIVSVLIVDDHPVVLDGIVVGLKLFPDILVRGTAKNAQEARALIMAGGFDVVICDLNLPKLEDGLNLISFTAGRRDCKIIALSYSSRPNDIYRANQAGASAYLIKDSDVDEIAAAIMTVHKGGMPPLAPGLEAALWEHLQQNSSDSFPFDLSDRELRVLSYLCRGATNDEIAKSMFISTRTVRKVNTMIYRKLSVRNRTQAVALVSREEWFDYLPDYA